MFKIPTVDELPLLLDDLVAQMSVLLEALHHKVLLSDHVVFEQSVRLHLGVFDLQLVDFTEQSQDLSLFLGADPSREQLLQTLGLVPQLLEPPLQHRLKERRWILLSQSPGVTLGQSFKRVTGVFTKYLLFISEYLCIHLVYMRVTMSQKYENRHFGFILFFLNENM